MVSLAAILTTDDCKEVQSVRFIVKNDGFKSDPEAISKHGITEEFASKYGVPRLTVLSAFHHLSACASTLIAYNFDFDKLILTGEFLRSNKPHPFDGNMTKWHCEMKAMTPICAIPNPYDWGDKYKWPKLEEAYKFAFNEPLEGAHDAMADVRAMIRIHLWRETRNKQTTTT